MAEQAERVLRIGPCPPVRRVALAMLDVMRQEGKYAAPRREPERKCCVLAGAELPRASDLTGLQVLQLLDWYFDRRLGPDIPDNVDAFAQSLGYHDRKRFRRRAIKRVYFSELGGRAWKRVDCWRRRMIRLRARANTVTRRSPSRSTWRAFPAFSAGAGGPGVRGAGNGRHRRAQPGASVRALLTSACTSSMHWRSRSHTRFPICLRSPVPHNAPITAWTRRSFRSFRGRHSRVQCGPYVRDFAVRARHLGRAISKERSSGISLNTSHGLELIPHLDWDNAQSGYGFIETGFGFDEDYGEHPFCLNFDILSHELGHSFILPRRHSPDRARYGGIRGLSGGGE